LLCFSFLCDFVPVKVEVFLISLFLESVLEELLAVIVVRLFIKTEISAVSKILHELVREVLAEYFDRCG